MRTNVLRALTLVLVVAGCGGGTALTHEELVNRANAACSEFDQRMSETQGNFGEPDYDRGALDAAADEVDALRELDPPEQDAAAFGRMVDHLALARDHYEASMDIPRSAEAQNDVLRSFGLLLGAREAAAQEARRLGLGVCAEEASDHVTIGS